MIGIIKLSFSEGRLGASKLEYMQKFADSQEHIIQTLAEISEAKSGETGQHVRRVSEYCKHIALQMGVSEETTGFFKIASMMHDVGKLMIPKDIIEKPDGLTPDEYEIVKAHTLYGEELLSKSDGQIIEMAKVIACQHHERWDGTGYPRGLKEDQIDFFAQITSVADVYDALSNKRAYKPAWKPEEALNEILKNKGTQFSPAVVDAFSAVYDKIEEVRIRYQD
ncbi:MAG: HD domain-containing protein [Lachnospiraceae bacterium]|nr:HD domain-containing protein [Lachnospiraceae bacterium]